MWILLSQFLAVTNSILNCGILRSLATDTGYLPCKICQTRISGRSRSLNSRPCGQPNTLLPHSPCPPYTPSIHTLLPHSPYTPSLHTLLHTLLTHSPYPPYTPSFHRKNFSDTQTHTHTNNTFISIDLQDL